VNYNHSIQHMIMQFRLHISTCYVCRKSLTSVLCAPSRFQLQETSRVICTCTVDRGRTNATCVVVASVNRRTSRTICCCTLVRSFSCLVLVHMKLLNFASQYSGDLCHSILQFQQKFGYYSFSFFDYVLCISLSLLNCYLVSILFQFFHFISINVFH